MTYLKRLLLVLCALGLLTAAYERINTPALMSGSLRMAERMILGIVFCVRSSALVV